MDGYRMGNVSPARKRSSTEADAVTALRNALHGLAEVRPYTEAREPILSSSVREVVRQWMMELRCGDELEAVGTKARKKMLLSGPPGTGKTTLAHHLSARLGMPLVIVGPQNIITKYLGDAGRSIEDLFRRLTEVKYPCILFLDEIDALGASRDSHGQSSASSELKNAVTVLLQAFEQYDGLVIAATNRKDALDQALWRRFEIQLTVDLPGPDERWAIIKLYSKPFDLDEDAIDVLTDLTTGASPALLEGLMLGMKRALVVNPRMSKPIDDPIAVFRPIVDGLKPPPEIMEKAVPALWTKQGMDSLVDLRSCWPPKLPAADPEPPPPG